MYWRVPHTIAFVLDTDYMPSTASAIPVPIPYTSSVPGSLPSHLAFRGRDHRVTLPKRCEPFLGRDSLVKDIQHEWNTLTSRRVSLSGHGGVGKTELSISIVEELGPMSYVLWLRASDDILLRQDLAKAAQDLRNELLRFESGDNGAMGAFYFSPMPEEELVNILKRWLKATPDDGSRILIVLDDLDGLESSYHEEYSFMFSGDALDLIYTTRDPSMADLGMLWPAVRFDVPSLQMDEAVDVLTRLSTGNRAAREHTNPSSVQHAAGLDLDTARKEQMKDIVTRLDALPAAVVIGSHYIKDTLRSNWNPDSYKRFLDSWDNGGGKSNILKSRRAQLRYRHSMLASYELSLHRLRRNVKDVSLPDKLEQYCLVLLQLFSAMDLHEISQRDLSEFKTALGVAWQDLQGKVLEAEFSDVVAEPQRLDHSTSISIDECVTQLVKVSLLTERSKDGTLLLSNLTKACALLAPTNPGAVSKMSDFEGSAKEVRKHFKPIWNSKSDNLDGSEPTS